MMELNADMCPAIKLIRVMFQMFVPCVYLKT